MPTLACLPNMPVTTAKTTKQAKPKSKPKAKVEKDDDKVFKRPAAAELPAVRLRTYRRPTEGIWTVQHKIIGGNSWHQVVQISDNAIAKMNVRA